MILKNNKTVAPWEVFHHSISRLLSVANDLNVDDIQLVLKELLPTYQPRSFITSKEIDKSYDSFPFKGQA